MHRCKKVGQGTDGLRTAEDEVTGGFQGEMEDRDDLSLHGRPKIDQNIAATDRIDLGDGWILDQILLGKDAHRPQGVIDAVFTFGHGKEAVQALARDVLGNALRVYAGAGPLEGRLVDVRGQDLDRECDRRFLQVLHQGYGQGICFLAGRAPRHPKPDGASCRRLHQLGERLPF